MFADLLGCAMGIGEKHTPDAGIEADLGETMEEDWSQLEQFRTLGKVPEELTIQILKETFPPGLHTRAISRMVSQA